MTYTTITIVTIIINISIPTNPNAIQIRANDVKDRDESIIPVDNINKNISSYNYTCW